MESMKIISISYDADVEDFIIKINEYSLFVPVRKILYLIELMEQEKIELYDHLKDLSCIVLNKDKLEFSDDELKKLLLFSDSERKKIIDMLKMEFQKNRKTDVVLLQKGFIKHPQKPFLYNGSDIIVRNMIAKYKKLFLENDKRFEDILTINLIKIISPKEEYECPSYFIDYNKDFLPAFKRGLDEALKIDSKNSGKINFFLMQDQRHTFLLIKINNNLFMFDSVGQRYGKSRKILGLSTRSEDNLKLDEISYTAMYLDYLKEHPQSKLFFNLNGVQQDTTNCFTFSMDFLDGLCGRILNFSEDISKKFQDYLIDFFPVQLEENKQIFHEGDLDVIFNLIQSSSKEELYEIVSHGQILSSKTNFGLLLPSEIARTSQLNTSFTEKVKYIYETISKIQTREAQIYHIQCKLTLFDEILKSTEKLFIRTKNGDKKEIVANRRIANLRKKQEQMLISI